MVPCRSAAREDGALERVDRQRLADLRRRDAPRRSERKPTLGVLRWRLLNQAETAVLEIVATNLFDLAGAGQREARFASPRTT